MLNATLCVQTGAESTAVLLCRRIRSGAWAAAILQRVLSSYNIYKCHPSYNAVERAVTVGCIERIHRADKIGTATYPLYSLKARHAS